MFMFKHQRSAGTRLEVEGRERGVYTSRLTACVYGDQIKLMCDIKLRGFYFIQSSHPSFLLSLQFRVTGLQGDRRSTPWTVQSVQFTALNPICMFLDVRVHTERPQPAGFKPRTLSLWGDSAAYQCIALLRKCTEHKEKLTFSLHILL